jgi:hypothetical protein
MGIEFRLGRNDHKVTEDFLATRWRVLDAITVEAHNAHRQAGVIEAARDAGVLVNIDLMLDRLQNPGFDYGPLPYVPSATLSGVALSNNAPARMQMVERAVEFQSKLDATIIAPHLHSDDALHDDLIIAMAADSIALAGSEPVRVIVAANRDRLAADDFAAARYLADGLAAIGVASVELRLSPTGDKDMSESKIRSMFAVTEVFTDVIRHVVLGYQGIVGPAALAMGLAGGFTTGIGLREQYNYTSLRKPHETDDDDDHAFGPQAGVRLPNTDLTVPRRFAEALYQDIGIRARLRCGYACCHGRIDGPAHDPRKHYLRSRTEELTAMLDRPVSWRPRMEQQRLERATDTIEMINAGHVPPKCHPIKVRTLRSLASLLDRTETTGTARAASA